MRQWLARQRWEPYLGGSAVCGAAVCGAAGVRLACACCPAPAPTLPGRPRPHDAVLTTALPLPPLPTPLVQLWQAVAEHVSNSTPDVIVLCQRVTSGMGAAAAAAAGQRQQQQQEKEEEAAGEGPSSADASGLRRAHSAEARAEDACRRLMASGVAESILEGKVGDCCESDLESDDEGPGHSHHHWHPPSERQQAEAAGIVPFLRTAKRRAAVRTAALGPAAGAGSGGGDNCSTTGAPYYWGVVVQSRGQPTGVEGAYLLKTVRSSSSTGCSCTHFSLTRICQGEHLERQFLDAWLAA